MNEKKILVHASGFIQGKERAINLGDSEQQIRAIKVLKDKFPDYKIYLIANSPNDMPINDSCQVIYFFSNYLSEIKEGLGKKVFIVLKILSLLINAVLYRMFDKQIIKDKNGKKYFDEIVSSEFIFYSGAGAFNNKYLKSAAGMWLVSAIIARIVKIPTVLVGQQFGPLKTGIIFRAIFCFAFSKSILIGCRDYESMNVCRELGLNEDVVRFTGDEGGYDLPKSFSNGKKILDELKVSPGFLAVHIRFDENCPFENQLEKFAEIVNSIAKFRSLDVILVPMCYKGKNADSIALRRLQGFLQVSSVILNCEDPLVVKEILAYSSLGIGVANHFVVFSASVGTPTIGVYATEYMRQKMEGARASRENVTSLSLTEFSIEKTTEIALGVMKDSESCRRPVAISQTLPPDYWCWLNKIGVSNS